MTLWDVPARLWTIARKLEDLLELQASTRTALEAVEARLRALEDRTTHLEANEGKIATAASAAAGVTAANAVGAFISEAVTRITRLEVRQEDIQRRLPPPGS